MTRTVKLEHGGEVKVSDSSIYADSIVLRLSSGSSMVLSPLDTRRLLGALTRSQAARRDRRATPVGPREA